CTPSTTSAPSSSRAATPRSGLGCCRRASTVPVRPTRSRTPRGRSPHRATDLPEHAARAFTNLGALAVRQHRHADARLHLVAGLDYCLERDLDAWDHNMPGSTHAPPLHR